jgi:tight adherence protein C
MNVFLKWAGPTGEAVNKSTGYLLNGYLDKLGRSLKALGEPEGLTPNAILGIQTIVAVIFPIFWISVFRFLKLAEGLFQGPVQILVYLGFIAFGFYFPYMNLMEKVRVRQKQILRRLPDVMDLLTISVEAGLDFIGALGRVVEKQPEGPLRDEFAHFFKQIELGVSRRDSLRELADRIQITDMNNVCSALIQADRLGSSLGPIMRAQSDMLRTKRGQRAEKAALEAPVKMMAPLLLCIFPAVFLMILAPVGIQIMMDKGLI